MKLINVNMHFLATHSESSITRRRIPSLLKMRHEDKVHACGLCSRSVILTFNTTTHSFHPFQRFEKNTLSQAGE